jgi:hypothetical protein
MGGVVHTSRIKIVRETGPTRRAMIERASQSRFIMAFTGESRGSIRSTPIRSMRQLDTTP